ncbi:MAG: hypothetical protein J5956_11420 [Ruminococcus sp.]|nr:hypothetical protein [Ruminococcus sp.]
MYKYAENNAHQCWSCQNNEGQDIIKVPYGSDSNKIYVEFAIPECKVTGLYMEKVNRCPCPYYKQISEKSSENNSERRVEND